MVFGLYLTENMRSKELWRAVLAEFVGTMMLVFLQIGGVVISVYPKDAGDVVSAAANATAGTPLSRHAFELDFSTILRISLCNGAVIGGVLFSLAHVSNHVNPSITLAFFILGQISLVRLAIFWVVQCLGALGAAGLLYACIPRTRENFFMCTMMDKNLSPGQGFGMEVCITALLIFGVITIYTKLDPNGETPGVPPVANTFFTSILFIIGIPISGASMNSARTIGPAIVLGGDCWDHHWIFWIGPLLGATLGGLFLRAMFSWPRKDKEQKEEKKKGKDNKAADAPAKDNESIKEA